MGDYILYKIKMDCLVFYYKLYDYSCFNNLYLLDNSYRWFFFSLEKCDY